jgi:hypothetical protein
MLPKFYQTFLENYLSPSQLLTLKMLVWLLQVQKQVKIERLAACLPLPILYESRRKHLQRFLGLSQLSIPLLWFPLIKSLIKQQFAKGSRLIIALDRTQWKDNNILMATVIWHKRAWPIYWTLLEKRGSSNLTEQQAVLRPVFRLLRNYELVVIGDREFRSSQLAHWLTQRKIGFVLRQKADTYIQASGRSYQALKNLGIRPGMKLFLTRIQVTQKKGFGQFNLAARWKRKYRGVSSEEPWYLLTNLNSLEEALKIYEARSGIEAMFKDCKTGGYNLEGTLAKPERLMALILLIALAYTSAGLKGQKTQQLGQEKYVNRLQEKGRVVKRHSNFWTGLYGTMWIIGWQFCTDWVRELMRLTPNKLPFFQRGLRAMKLIQATF